MIFKVAAGYRYPPRLRQGKRGRMRRSRGKGKLWWPRLDLGPQNHRPSLTSSSHDLAGHACPSLHTWADSPACPLTPATLACWGSKCTCAPASEPGMCSSVWNTPPVVIIPRPCLPRFPERLFPKKTLLSKYKHKTNNQKKLSLCHKAP